MEAYRRGDRQRRPKARPLTGQAMRTDWRAVRVHPNASMLQAMAVVSDGRIGIALVVDEDDRLMGTVTDGDMRRAILQQEALDTMVTSIMERSFTAVAPGADSKVVLDLMRSLSIRQVPVCDPTGKVVGLYLLDDLGEPLTRPNWAVIMAGGQGRRLWPLTAYVPKPMLPVGGKPMIELILAQLVRHGFRRVFVSINHLADSIIDHLGDGHAFGCSVEYLRETEPLGTGGSLALLPETPELPILVTNGDLLTDLDLSDLMDYHGSHGAAATLCVRELSYQIPYGVVTCEGDDVVSIEEKPAHKQLINAGMYVLDPELLSLLPRQQHEYPLPRLIDEAHAAGLGVKAFAVEGEWMDVGYLEEYDQARGSPLERTGD